MQPTERLKEGIRNASDQLRINALSSREEQGFVAFVCSSKDTVKTKCLDRVKT
jgi:hypothetical protein